MKIKYFKMTIGLFPLLTMGSYSYAESEGESSGFGPLMVRSQAPLQSSGVNTRLRDASDFVDSELFLSASAASVWAESEDYTLDYYQNDIFVGFQMPINKTLKAEFSYTFRYAANNHLDSLTISFHDMIGMSQNGREDVDNNRFYISSDDYTNEDFEDEILGSSWELYLEQLLFDNESHSLSLGGTLYYNYLPSGPFENTAFEQALQLNYTGKFGQYHTVYMMGSVTHRTPDSFSGISLKEWAINGGIGYQYRPSFRHAYLLEYRRYEGEAEEISDLSEPVNEITLGYRLHFGLSAVELAVVENIINMDNSADIALTLSFRHRI